MLFVEVFFLLQIRLKTDSNKKTEILSLVWKYKEQIKYGEISLKHADTKDPFFFGNKNVIPLHQAVSGLP